MRDPLSDPLAAAALAAALTLVVAALAAAAVLRARRQVRSRRAVRRARRAAAGERAAERLLADAGWTIDDTQATRTWTIHVDGVPVEVELRCDALVSRDGRRLVAEVKTGDRAPDLSTAATRRQLLEYVVAYGADGVLLVDPEAGLAREVDFGLAAPSAAPPPPAATPLLWLAAGVVAGMVAGAVLAW